jgi:sarcosine oxidase
VKLDYEYIVVGLGGIGSGAAYWLARRAGKDVLGLEQFHLGHDNGASQDHSRIIRYAYHTPQYVELAKSAYDAWEALEADLDDSLIVTSGGLDFFPPDGDLDMEDYTSSLAACDIPFEVLDDREATKRYPVWRLDEGTRVVYQPDAGIAPAARCNAAHARLAREHGATLVEHSPVTGIQNSGGGFDVAAGERVYHCRRLVVAADMWTNDVLANLGIELPLTRTQEQVTYFASPNVELFVPTRFPVFIWHDAQVFYGLPVYGEPGPKIAQDVGGAEVTPETRTFEPDPGNLERVVRFCEGHLPDALGPTLLNKTCIYTLTPDRDFVVDELPDHPGAFAALGAGHGFKFASLLGRILSELAIDGATAHDISAFAIDRQILEMKDPPKTFAI